MSASEGNSSRFRWIVGIVAAGRDYGFPKDFSLEAGAALLLKILRAIVRALYPRLVLISR
jgi:hypothetical protein